MAKVIAVVGSDGPIGYAVANSLEKDPAITVNRVPYYDSENLNSKIKGADGCFVVSYTDFNNTDNELSQGKKIADACKAAGIPHVIFSTQLNPLKCIGVMSLHLVAKAEIEEYMREQCLPLSLVMVPCVYEDLMGDLKPECTGGNNYALAIPMGMNSFDMVSLDDLGAVVNTMFANKNEYLSKTVSVCGDKRTIKEMAGTLTRRLPPLVFKDKQVTVEQFAQQHQQANKIWAQDYANMFDFFGRFDQRYNVQKTKDMTKNPNIQNFDNWVIANAGKLKQAFMS